MLELIGYIFVELHPLDAKNTVWLQPQCKFTTGSSLFFAKYPLGVSFYSTHG